MTPVFTSGWLRAAALRLIALLPAVAAATTADNVLRYDEPAAKWVEALPVGNGRIGAMIFGGVGEEHLQFNEETLWTGEPHDYSHPGAADHLAEIRRLLAEGKQREATTLAGEVFMSEPLHQKSYQAFGDLYLCFPGHADATNYRRALDLEAAIASVSYDVDGTTFRREVFASHPDDLIAVRLTANRREALNFEVRMDSVQFNKSVFTDGDRQTLDVRVLDGVIAGKAGLRVFTEGGEITNRRNTIVVTGATRATIYLSAYTNFVNYHDVSGNPRRDSYRSLDRYAKLPPYGDVRRRHVADYQSLYQRFEIEFGGESRTDLTTDQRIEAFWQDPADPQLLALYVQYARYLMISSSRPGTQPANLQGIWNPDLEPPWDSKWTLNMNAPMNYWPAEMANLAECHEPLFDLIKDLSETGAQVAKVHYGSRGWVVHHNTDIWRGAAPINASNHGIWQGGSGWLCLHLWEHYLFSRDEAFLAEWYPVIRDAARFYADTLFEDPDTGWLISSPSNSPEIGGLVAGPTMDHQIIRTLFGFTVEASRILDRDHAFAAELEGLLPRIAPNQIGRLGQLQEWLEDKDDPEEHHRHVAHLWAVHPAWGINGEETPDLMKAARQSLLFRGDGGTGWSLAWKINFWARFRDGNHAYTLVHNLLSPAQDPRRKPQGGSYPNLFDAHPPFQIDGNFGGAAGMIELVLQSHLGSIDLLPALPDGLPAGRMVGARARGGFEVDLLWSEGRLDRVDILSTAGEDCVVRYGDRRVSFPTEAGKSYRFDGNLKPLGGPGAGKHLFILSGQSNMGGLDPRESFIPAVSARFGRHRTITVKDALGGQPISRWVKGWKSARGTAPETTGDLYDRLLAAVREATAGEEIASVSFFWMQGERDARNADGAVYEDSLERLVEQLRHDLGRDDLNVVVGRLSDCGLQPNERAKFPDWQRVRSAQEAFVQAGPHRALVNTDDLNDGINRAGKVIGNNLHYSADGYRIFGERLATEAIALIDASFPEK